jgi:hypothetical protein
MAPEKDRVVSEELSKKADSGRWFGAETTTTRRKKTMTHPTQNDETINLTKKELQRALSEDDALKKLMQTLLEKVLEAEMDDAPLPVALGRE